MVYIISFIVVLGILIFVHEFGHFIVARKLGIGVLKFSLGFGPKVFGFEKGGTEYLVSAVPLGGYVKLLGETPDEEIPPEHISRSFSHSPAGSKLMVVAAGPLFNIIFAALVFCVVFMAGVPVLKPVVGDVVEDSPAFRAGIEKGDVIVSINERAMKRWEDIAVVIKEQGTENPLSVVINRGDRIVNLVLQAEEREVKNIFGESVREPKIGIIAKGDYLIKRYNPFSALFLGIKETGRMIYLTVVTIVKLIERVIPADTLGGPILIAQIAGDQAKQGITPFFYFLALLSVNLGILNLLPIPILDGGHILIFSLEAITGRTLSMKVKGIVQQIGLVIIITLTILVFYNDIARILTK